MKLSALPKAFGLKSDISKGTFPFYFNTKENQTYVCPLPDKKFYGSEGISAEVKKKFDEWYDKLLSENYVFDFKKEMKSYCQLDVCILREACLQFRKLFLEIGKVCPFSKAVTLAGACSVIYRKDYLKKNTIGIPVGGYRRADNFSTISLEWFIYEEHKLRNEKILHAERGREYYITDLDVHVDGYQEADGKKYVYQLHGCFYHTHNCLNSGRNKERYEETLKLNEKIRSLGYEPIVMWECEFKKIKNKNKFLFDFLLTDNAMLFGDVPNPREAFFGGRTGNMVKYYNVKNKKEKIHYIDICSLYPSVCKFGKFPIGHPTIYVGNECHDIVGEKMDISQVEGLINCLVLPPQDLIDPDLPVKAHNRLFFPLC